MLGIVHQVVAQTAEIFTFVTSDQLGSLLPKLTVKVEPSLETLWASSERKV